ncbi:hypothetical protein Tco_0813456 [Tanacetum coccineum]
MESMHSTPSMYYDYDAHVKGELLSDDEKLSKFRLRYSNPMIQPEPEGSTQGYPLVRVEVLRCTLMKFWYAVKGLKNEKEMSFLHGSERLFKDRWWRSDSDGSKDP